MKEKMFRTFLIGFIIVSVFFSGIFISSAEDFSEINILYVGGIGSNNYSSIQDAINDSSDDDIIFVYNGVYKENIVIDKKISLIGENKKFTVIDGCTKGDTILIRSEDVVFCNFTVKNGDIADPIEDGDAGYLKAGIRVEKSNCIIKNNIFKDNRQGIFGIRVTNLSIINNTLINDGVTFSPYDNTGRPAIKKEYFLHHFKNNTVNGKQLLYVKDKSNIDINGELGQLIVVNCTGLTISISVSNISVSALIMAYCDFCVVENSEVVKNEGIWTFKSSHNLFRYNNLSNNTFHGITLDYMSNNNVIKNNRIANNDMTGVILEYYSKFNLITGNNLIGNKLNAYTTQAFRNKFYHNFWDNWKGLNNSLYRFFSKLIRGRIFDCPTIKIIRIIPWFSCDNNPALEPFEI